MSEHVNQANAPGEPLRKGETVVRNRLPRGQARNAPNVPRNEQILLNWILIKLKAGLNVGKYVQDVEFIPRYGDASRARVPIDLVVEAFEMPEFGPP